MEKESSFFIHIFPPLKKIFCNKRKKRQQKAENTKVKILEKNPKVREQMNQQETQTLRLLRSRKVPSPRL